MWGESPPTLGPVVWRRMGTDELWDWPCPYCRSRIPLESAVCSNCGARLRDTADDLFAQAPAPKADRPLLAEALSEPSLASAAQIAPDAPAVPFAAVAPAAPVVEVAAPVEDPQGLSAAVARLRPEDADVATLPICAAGVLLDPDEHVRVAVTGQMLGHPAVVVLTDRRVLVVNGRRWQPIVDTFGLGASLVVRGRHDRHVALLTFSEGSRLSTVDAITDVGLAVELTECIRTG